VRPLIYPSDLQRLNKPGDIGHSIIVTFGNYPLKTYFSPSFKVPFYKIGKMDTSELAERFFDENEVFYSADARNKIVFNVEDNSAKPPVAKEEAQSEQEETENETENETEISVSEEDDAKIELINAFIAFKENNPQGTLQDFYMHVAGKINKEESDD
jgi:hypothetical protein